MALTVAAAVACSVGLGAEQRWGVVAGVNLNNFPGYQRGDYRLYDVNTNSLGVTAGVTGEMMFPGIGFGVSASLLYDYVQASPHLGQCEAWHSMGVEDVQKATMHVLEIPLSLRYRYINLNGIENKIFPFVFGGPTVNVLLAGGSKEYYAYTGVSLGLHAGFGVELMRRVQVAAVHEWGLSQSFKTHLLEDNAHKMRSWHIRATYFF